MGGVVDDTMEENSSGMEGDESDVVLSVGEEREDGEASGTTGVVVSRSTGPLGMG